MIALRDIANPVIRPEAIIVSEILSRVPASLLSGFKEYLGISHDSEDTNLSNILVAILREIAHPTSLGLSMNIGTWKMRVLLYSCAYVYLPRYNGMNLSVLNFDTNGVTMEAEWKQAGIYESPGNISMVKTDADEIPYLTEFEWTVGFNPEDFPPAVRQMVYMEAGFRREFPLGVDDRGQSVPELPRAVELIRDEWMMKSDLRGVPEFATYRANNSYFSRW